MNLYIVNEVLSDWTSGMVVIAAADIADAREVFESEFESASLIAEFDKSIADGSFKVIEGVNHARGMVSYVFGGG